MFGSGIYFLLFALVYGGALAEDLATEKNDVSPLADRSAKVHPPRSPCPAVFKYASDYLQMARRGKETYAYITVKKDGKSKAKLELKMQVRGIWAELFNKREEDQPVSLSNITPLKDLMNDTVETMEYKLTIRPTRTHKIPQPYQIKFNGNTICLGPKYDKDAAEFSMAIENTVGQEEIDYVSSEI